MIGEKYKQIGELFKKYEVDGFVNVTQSQTKDLEYSPLHDEIGIDGSDFVATSVVIIKNHKKSYFSLDGFSLDAIDEAMKAMVEVIDYGEYDEDIILPDVFDNVEKDFSVFSIDAVDFEYLEQEFNKVKNYKFSSEISIEGFSIGAKVSIHHYVNSHGAYKMQKDSSGYFYVELFWENGENRETEYLYKNFQNIPSIPMEEIEKLQQVLLNKITPNTKTFPSGTYTITLDRDVVVNFLEIVLDNLWAESIREGMSMFSKNKLGDTIFWPLFTIVNNPNLVGYTWNCLFDGEWITQNKTTLFDKGVFCAKFYDYKNALKDGLEYLGNSHLHNLEWQCENPNPNYLQDSQFLFTNLMAFHTVDSTTWKFSLNGEGYIIENGTKKEFVKNVSLSWDVVHLFNSIHAIGDDFIDNGNTKVPSVTFVEQKVI